MSGELRARLRRNIERTGRYPPVVVRPHPARPGYFQLLDGAQRVEVLRAMGHVDVAACIWECNDADALLLLATLNRLHGEDEPYRRAALLDELQRLVPRDVLAGLLPEDAGALAATLALVDLDRTRLLDELAAAAARSVQSGPRLLSFAVPAEDEALVEAAVARAVAGLTGQNRRGRALAAICAAYLEDGDA